MIAENLDAFMDDFAVDVSDGGSSFKGILDQPDETIGLAISTEYQLTAKTSDVEDYEDGDTLTIDSESYQVRANKKLSDGKFSVLTLSKGS